MRSLLTLSASLLLGGVLFLGCDSYGEDGAHEEPRNPPKKYVTVAEAPPPADAVRLDAR